MHLIRRSFINFSVLSYISFKLKTFYHVLNQKSWTKEKNGSLFFFCGLVMFSVFSFISRNFSVTLTQFDELLIFEKIFAIFLESTFHTV